MDRYKNQCQKLWDWLYWHEGITSLEAALNPELGIGRLASRVEEMRHHFDPPMPVKDKWVVTKSGKRVKFYYREKLVVKPMQLKLIS